MVKGAERAGTTGLSGNRAIRGALAAYSREIVCTDKLPRGELEPVVFGLFGEVGSVLAVVKKEGRDGIALPGREALFTEELADVLWYFATLSRRLGVDLDQLFVSSTDARASSGVPHASEAVEGNNPSSATGDANIRLGEAAARLLRVEKLDRFGWEALRTFGICYMRVIDALDLAIEDVIHFGVRKARDGFVLPALSSLPRFDVGFPDNERLPDHFEIAFTQRSDGRCEMAWDGSAIGDPLNDATMSPDGFRFHDVFHLAHVAVLHWSPTFRAIAGRKRKSLPEVDDAEDGGRARVVEEGIVAWVFGRAKELDFFKGQQLVAFDLLKTIAEFVQGFEVERCPLRLWERAILNGYDVFREVQRNQGGVVIGDREERTLRYRRADS